MTEMRNHPPITPVDQPLEIVAEKGVVLVDGPGGVALTLTSQAASDTARSMARAANAAEEQRKLLHPRRH